MPFLRNFLYISLITLLLLPLSCRENQRNLKKNPEALKTGDADPYTVAYTYAVYLSTTKKIQAEEAIPLINDLISMGYPTEARYVINNLKSNGIHSYDLLALRGLCYMHELQLEKAGVDLEAALKGDPGNEKILILMNNFRKQSTEADELPPFEILIQSGMEHLQKLDYDSALYFFNAAMRMENRSEYAPLISRLENIIEGGEMILSAPGNYKAYMLKSQGLSALKLYEEAQKTLDAGLVACPENLNLILAKALVWVQEGESETARLYLWEQEQQGIVIDPGVKQNILQTQN